MDKVKRWVALAAVVSVGVLAAGWFLLVQPKHAEAAELRAQAEQEATANDAMRTHLAVLKAQARNLPKQQAKLAEVSEEIPDDPALPSLIRALMSASEASGVEFLSLTPGTPTAAGSLSLVPVTINVVGGYYEVEHYVTLLEDLPRALRVSNLAVTPGTSPVADTTGTGDGTASSSAATDGSSLVTVISGTVFMAPAGAAAATTATTATTDAVGTATTTADAGDSAPAS